MNTDKLAIDFIIIISAYLIGSISTAIISCKLLKLPDPRKTGSNNPGATNVLRSGGKKAGAITLAGDMLKRVIARTYCFTVTDNHYCTGGNRLCGFSRARISGLLWF